MALLKVNHLTGLGPGEVLTNQVLTFFWMTRHQHRPRPLRRPEILEHGRYTQVGRRDHSG
jgi:hypothetical protein